MRGVRFNFVKRLVDSTPRDELAEIASRIAELGWHVVVYFEAQDLPGLWDFFSTLPTTIVVDHMGRPDVSKPVDGPEFDLFMRFMAEHNNVWSKVTCPERLSLTGPKALNGEGHAYRDVPSGTSGFRISDVRFRSLSGKGLPEIRHPKSEIRNL